MQIYEFFLNFQWYYSNLETFGKISSTADHNAMRLTSSGGRPAWLSKHSRTGFCHMHTCMDIWHGKAQNFRKPIKESHGFRPSWQARLGTHSRQDADGEGVVRLKPRHESAKTTFRNDLLARDWLLNQLGYNQLRPYRPVKRVETETVITHVTIGRGQRQNQDKLKDGQKMGKRTCAIVRSVVNITGSFQCRLCTRPSPVTGTGLSNTCADRWRGQVENFDPLDRRD